ncbi:hypothetical protein [Streptomyces kurssanovii]|uniref:Uncharacterized protein n=1 Tax=Streptomyces kurssanovii TaxID=67312 RepID=A0ABV3I524_9ACTN
MTTPHNPYGQQPNPYGGPPQPQPPYPGQAAPPVPQQPGYGGQPYPPAGGWGAPSPYPYAPPVQPPKKDHTARNVVIVMASIVGLIAFGWVATDVIRPAGGGGTSYPAAEYRLTAPRTLLDGKYELADDQSAQRQKELESSPVDETDIRDPQATVAQYTSTSEGGVLVLSGMHGRIKNPDTARGKMLDGAATADGATLAVPAKDVTPAGSEVTITCQVVTMTQDGGGTSSLPICAWADDNTNASVTVVTAATSTKSPQDIDLDAAAEATAKVREEIRKPLS